MSGVSGLGNATRNENQLRQNSVVQPLKEVKKDEQSSTVVAPTPPKVEASKDSFVKAKVENDVKSGISNGENVTKEVNTKSAENTGVKDEPVVAKQGSADKAQKELNENLAGPKALNLPGLQLAESNKSAISQAASAQLG